MLKCYSGMERYRCARYVNGGVLSGEVPNALAVLIDRPDDFIERRGVRPHWRRIVPATGEPAFYGCATGEAKANQ